MPFELTYHGKDTLSGDWFKDDFLSTKMKAFENIINDPSFGFFMSPKMTPY